MTTEAIARFRDALDRVTADETDAEKLLRVAEAVDALRDVVSAQYAGASPALALVLDMIDDALREAFAAAAHGMAEARRR